VIISIINILLSNSMNVKLLLVGPKLCNTHGRNLVDQTVHLFPGIY
jgi:hypothetical protein